MKTVLVVKNGCQWTSLMDILPDYPVIQRLCYADSYAKARMILMRRPVDAVFIFLTPNDDQGLKFLRTIDGMIDIVIISFSADLARFAFEIDALDFIYQPDVPGRVALTMKRMEKTGIRSRLTSPHIAPLFQKILVAGSQQQHILSVKDIMVITACGGNYTSLSLADRDINLLRKSLNYWESMLPVSLFQRIHRSTIINMSHIKMIDKKQPGKYRVWLQNRDRPFLVSRRRRKDFHLKMQQIYPLVTV